MHGRLSFLTALVVASLCLLGVLPRPAEATFPGKPGAIVFSLISIEQGVAEPTGGLYAINPDGSGLRQLTTNPRDYEPSFSPSGRRLAFRRFGTNYPGLYVLNIRTGNAKRVVAGQGDQDAAFGRRGMIAFTRPVREGGYELFIRNRNGRLRRLTRTRASEQEPVFTPNGKRIVFARDYTHFVVKRAAGRSTRPRRIYSIRTDGTGLKLLEVTGAADNLDIAPYGRRVTFGSGLVWRQPLRGGSKRLIALDATHPAYSPAGGKVAYSNHEGIWIKRADGGGQPQLVREALYTPFESDDQELAIQPAWQPLPR